MSHIFEIPNPVHELLNVQLLEVVNNINSRAITIFMALQIKVILASYCFTSLTRVRSMDWYVIRKISVNENYIRRYQK